MYVEGNQPRTTRRELAELLQGLSGLVRISDPYYGVRSFDFLDMIPKECTVQLLTSRISDNQAKFSVALSDFRRERTFVEIRIVSQPNMLHDRYLLTPDRILILGHGIKDIGSKESFVVAIDRQIAHDLVAQLIQTFDSRWQTATPL